MSLQNLKESQLYDLLPEGIVQIDERGLLQAVVGGIQDRIEDLRFYVKKFEVIFDTHAIESVNTVVLVTFETPFGKVITRSLDPDDTTPLVAGADLTAWASGQLGIDSSSITSCDFGTDLLRFIDINTLQYIAANIGAVLYSTVAQQGTAIANQQRILDSYFPRLKIKGTIQSFDALGRLLGFDDIIITPLWGRLNPRRTSDFGSPDNDQDFAFSPVYLPQQIIGIQYNPYDMRDGPFFSWSGTVVKDQSDTRFYSAIVNKNQPWVNVFVTGTVNHPPVNSFITLEGGGPHAKAFASFPGSGLKFEAVGEGSGFNGLQVNFSDWNSGTDRIVSIVDRLSTIKYRTSYFDISATVTEERAIAQFGTIAAKKSLDLENNPSLTVDGVAAPPFRPWWSGSAVAPATSQDFTHRILDGPSVPVPSDLRLQATSANTQFNISPIQNVAVQYVGAIDEVRPATRQPRRVKVGFLDRDQAGFAAFLDRSTIISGWTGTTAITGVATKHIDAPYLVEFEVDNGTVYDLTAELDPLSNGTIVRFTDGILLAGTYNYSTNSYWFSPLTNLPGITLDALWSPTSTEVVRSYSGTDVLRGYQRRPEDAGTIATQNISDTSDEYPWRADITNGGELVEVVSHIKSTVPEFGVTNVENAMAVKDHTGMEFNIFGVPSTVTPIRVVAEAKDAATYVPGQIPICYRGTLKSLNDVPANDLKLPGNFSSALDTYFGTGAKLFHTGLVQGVLVADPITFFGPHNRNGLVAWLPMNEHPDEGQVVFDRSSSSTDQVLSGFTLTGSFANRLWSNERGWYLEVVQGGTLVTHDHRDLAGDYTLSVWVMPEGSLASTGTLPIFSFGPVQLELPDDKNYLSLKVLNRAGTNFDVGAIPVYPGTFSNVVVTLTGTRIGFGSASLSQSLSLGLSTMDLNVVPFNELSDDMIISYGSHRGYAIQDLRMWNLVKTASELGKIHHHTPVSTICTYWPTTLAVVSTGDQYGMRATDAGFVYPDQMPPAVRLNRLVRLQRYNSMGRFSGEPRRKEVGLGGGVPLPQIYQLGQQFFNLTATGTTVVSFGTIEGNPRYIDARMEDVNPCREFVWIKASNGTLFEASLRSSGTAGAELFGTHAPTAGYETSVISNGYVLVIDATSGTAYKSGTSSTAATPSLFMYLNNRVKEDITDAHSTWTSKNDPTLFGNKQSPPVAALTTNGILEFENTSTLNPGNYRLTIVSGNIGKVDDDFDGYSVEITVGDLLLVSRLAVDKSGANFTASDVIEFELPETVAANWFLSVSWLNAFRNDARGVARQFAIFSYKLEKIQTELFEITINNAGTWPAYRKLDAGVYSGTVHGGWLATVNSYGSVVQWRHESLVYPQNDTVTAIVPLSDTLTSNTAFRREDHLLARNTGSNVLLDSNLTSFPIFGSITVV